MAFGFRIKERFTRVPAQLAERFRGLPTANVSDAMARIQGAGAALRPLHEGSPLLGPALTVRTRPGDNLMVHKAMDLAEPGDVIVIDGGGDLENALIGELMITYAQLRGVAGFVVQGAVRDLDFIRNSPMPVFAMGVTHRGPYKSGPGEIGFPIRLGAMVVAPGDLILGDADGVVAIPRGEAEQVLAAARAKQEAEQRQMAATLARTLDRSWVDAELAKLGCERDAAPD